MLMKNEQIIRSFFHGYSDEQWEDYKTRFPFCEILPIVEKCIQEHFIEIRLRSDDSGHEYLIPTELNNEFSRLLDIGEEADREFEEKFSKYRQGGRLPNLYLKKE